MENSTENRPGGRQRNITGTGKVEKRGEGHGTDHTGSRTKEAVLKIIAGFLAGKSKNNQ